MPENPQDKKNSPAEAEKTEKETAEKGSWSEDRKTRSYYYDDACGYEVYNPDEDEDEEK